MQSWLIGFGQFSPGDPRIRKFFTNSDGSWTKCSVNCNIWGRSSDVWWILVALFFFPGWSMVFLAPRQEIHLTPAARPVVAERVWELGGMDLGLKHEHGNSGWYLMVLHGKIITFSYFFHDFWQLKHHFPAVFSRWPCCKPGSHLAYGRHPPDRFLAERPKLGNFYGDLRCRNGDFGDLWTLKHRLKRRNYKK